MPRDGSKARARLREAALELYRDRGYDATTTAQIAARAGVTERTYFRHFADKREVLFDGEAELRTILLDAVAAAPPGLAPLPVLVQALEAAVPLLIANRPVAEQRAEVIAVTPALRERAYAKTAALTDALAQALVGRGTAPPTARLAAQIAMATFDRASRHWREDPTTDLSAAITQAADEVSTLSRCEDAVALGDAMPHSLLIPVQLDEARQFLRSRFSGRASEVAELGSGAWSRAFSFRLDARELVIRFGQHREDYEIDRQAMSYTTTDLPIPEVIEIGAALGGAYAISERRFGRFLESLDPQGWHRLLPALWRALDAMRAEPEAWPQWVLDQPELARGPGGRWGAQLLASIEDRPDERVSGWRAILAGFPDLDDLFTTAKGRFVDLLAACPTRGHLIHCDLLNRNVLVSADSKRLSAVYDWSCQRRGDFLYDVAWFTFWAPWHPGLAAIDIRARALEHYRASSTAVPSFEERLHCYELHIGLEHLAYNAFTGDHTELQAVGQRLRALLAPD